MHLKTGTIVLFNYNKHKEDKFPLALILHDKDKYGNVHAINLNYLTYNLTQDVINMILKIINNQLDARDIYKLYHGYMLDNLSPVIKRAYRTYKKKDIMRPRIINKGFAGANNLLNRLFTNNTDIIKKQTQALNKQIVKAKEISKTITPMTHAEAQRKAEEYIKMINGITSKTTDTYGRITTTKRKKEILR